MATKKTEAGTNNTAVKWPPEIVRQEGSPTISGKEELVLQLLTRRGEMYGLELVEAAKGGLKRGTVYVTLQRMAEKGFVESRQEEAPDGEGGLPRRFFRASGYGARVLGAKAAFDAALNGGEVLI